MRQIIQALLDGQTPSVPQLAALLRWDEDQPLFDAANQVRRQCVGDKILIRALLEFSNHCKRNCAYCGLRKQDVSLERYRIDDEEITALAYSAYKAGYKTLVLQSGEDPFYTCKKVCDLLEKIKKSCPEMAITLSIGERPAQEYRQFFQHGANRFLLKHESASEEIYSALHVGATLSSRVQALRDIKQAGLETGSGFMIGLPGQTEETIARDLLLLKKLGCDMAGIGPFIPHPQTPLKDRPSGSIRLTKKAVAIARLLLPHSNLPATTSLGVLSADDKQDIFSCGANVIMQKITPWKYLRYYEIYPANWKQPPTILQARAELEQNIRKMGRIPC